MKKIIHNTFTNLILVGVSFFVLTTTSAVAQYDPWIDQNPSTYTYNYDTYTNPNIDYTAPSYTTGNSGWIDQNPSTYQYNYNTYTNPTVSYVAPTYTTGNSGWIDQNPSTYQYNYNTYTNPNIGYVASTCTSCGPTYTAPTYSAPTYSAPTYTSPTYTTPTYTTPTYTSPSYSYTPSYTYPSYTSPSYTYNPITPITPIIPVIPPVTPVICQSGTHLVNGSCVIDTTVCPTGTTLVNGVCQVNSTSCPAGSHLSGSTCVVDTTVCPSGTTLVNGVCQVNSTSCAAGSHLVNGSCVIDTTVCPAGSTLISGVCQAPITCPAGTVLTNGTCLGNGTTVCPSGTTLINGVCQINSTSCPAGSVLQNGICTITTVINRYTCPNGSVVDYAFQCPVTPIYTYPTPPIAYQTCWDGSRIPGFQTCPTQYKTCADGSYVLSGQSCYKVPLFTPPTVIAFNNVVTSVATQITNTSGRCNGIGLIAAGAPSTGWFEYGETANLGRITGSANIGTADTAPFSNVLANLKPHTTYYCRAVMQNKHGVVKGEIVSFITTVKATKYVREITPVKHTTKKVVAKKAQVTCTDNSTLSLRGSSETAMLEQGNKLVTLTVEKTEGKLIAKSPVSYKVTYKNMSGTRLTGVVVKVVIPVEIKQVMATAGSLDENTHTLTLNQDTMDAYSEGIITISGILADDAPLGKTIVATSYVSYTVPGTHAQDEVTAYVVGSILPADTMAKVDTGAKKVIGVSNQGDRGFMPSNLVEWLALIAIMFIIFILGRSIYLSYQEDEEGGHGH